jgi:hypothetical protein
MELPPPDVAADEECGASARQGDFCSANCFLRKAMLEQLGGFDERFALAWRDDSDLHFRLLAGGAAIAHAPLALVVRPPRLAPWGASVLQARQMFFDALLYRKHPQLYREKIRIAPRWQNYCIVAALMAAAGALAAGLPMLALSCGALWLGMTAHMCLRRLQGSEKTLSNVAEIIVTSVLIPPATVFWRLAGAIRFRVPFV